MLTQAVRRDWVSESAARRYPPDRADRSRAEPADRSGSASPYASGDRLTAPADHALPLTPPSQTEDYLKAPAVSPGTAPYRATSRPRPASSAPWGELRNGSRSC